MTGPKSTLAAAIERRNWELAALCLLVGVAEQAARLPPETLERLLDLLEVADRDAKRSR